jgi:hypothetical protein
MNWNMVGTCVTASICFGTLVTLSFLIRQSWPDCYLNLAILVLGTLVGWVIGILSAPYTKKEEGQFALYGKAVSVFFSGYLLGKIDRLTTTLLSPEVLLRPVPAFRVVAFIASALLAAIITRTFRVYWA